MKNKLIKTMIIILLIQVGLFGIAIFGGNTIQSINDEYLNILENRVEVRRNDLEDEMLQRWSNIMDFEEYIQKEFKNLGVKENLSLIPDLLEKMAYRVVFHLRQAGVTEIFVILEGEKGHEGIYLRDLDPHFNANDNSDILLERGSIEIAQKLKIPLDSEWSYNFNLTERNEKSEFYYKPYVASKLNPELNKRDLGYWSKPFRLSEDDVEIITYSLPLRDEDGQTYGVMGVGLTTEFLSRKLKYDELTDNKRGFYTLNRYDAKIGKNDTAVSSGPLYNVYAKSNTISYEKIDEKNIYEIKDNDNIEGAIYASSKNLNLYSYNSPFRHELWSLIGFIEKSQLFKPIREIIISIFISLFLSLIVGISAVYLSGTLFMRPINELMESIIDSDPNKPLEIKRTSILEIDKLGSAIESLNNQVLDSASKLSQIINMVNMPIGAFEYIDDEEKAFCTDGFFNLLGLKNEDSVNYIEKSYLVGILNEIKKYPVKDMEDIYNLKKDDGKNCFLKLLMQEKEGKVLGVIEDITEEVVSKRKMEYERDHDVLTYLLNRRAFESKVKNKLEREVLGYSAIVMWDLDNLKYVNDTYGHEYGDRYIQKAADVLKKFTIYNTIISRMSGDEFFIFIYDYEDKAEIREIINKMQESLYGSFLQVPDGEKIRIRASGGVSWYPDDSSNYYELIKYTDFAMYEIKNTEKGNIGEFNIDNYNKDSILLHGKEELNFFIDNAMVKYAFQPIVNSKTGEIFAYESLMRPQTKKLKSPYDVIRLAQSQSKLYEIEKITLFESLKAYEKLRNHFKDSKLFINSIPNHSLSEEDLDIFEERFAEHLDKIVIEITENEQSNEESTKLKQIKAKEWGTHLALDDFGSGYNGELSLLILSPKYVKIDMNIIRGIDKDVNRQKLLLNILSYCKNRDIKIIAEGVETKEEMKKLIEFEVDYMQGYYLGKPKLIPEDIDDDIKKEIQLMQENL